MDPRMLPKGLDPNEHNAERTDNSPGVYYHPGAKKFVETAANNPGRIQADALVQMQYRKATEEEANQFRAEREERMKAQEAEEKSKRLAKARSV